MTDLSLEQKEIAREVEHIFKNLAAVAVAKELKSGAVEIFKLAKKLKKKES